MLNHKNSQILLLVLSMIQRFCTLRNVKLNNILLITQIHAELTTQSHKRFVHYIHCHPQIGKTEIIN